MFSIAKTLPLALTTAVTLLLASTAQAQIIDLGVSDIGVIPPPTLALSTLDAFDGVPDNGLELPAPEHESIGAADVVAVTGRGEMSPLPSPATWAMMLAGFGLTGAMLRRGQLYRLVEQHADGATQTESFHAPDDQSALERALSVAEGVRLELWRGDELVHRMDAPVQAAS